MTTTPTTTYLEQYAPAFVLSLIVLALLAAEEDGQ